MTYCRTDSVASTMADDTLPLQRHHPAAGEVPRPVCSLMVLGCLVVVPGCSCRGQPTELGQ
ncbi:hypothetical protein ADL22_01995 [Streptomyces sp. NRRL F-4489]|nr:hypothetical protein ADL22_01995 [Streptomyces sp. NRRL F-4489]